MSRSPFPPIADFAFLSDCHTGALVAPDGSVGWLCTPRFDSPSVFGSLLDRQAGYLRLGPFGISTPSERAYEPGTNVLATTWRTPTGWAIVRDALVMGPRHAPDLTTPHDRPPSDDDAYHRLVRTVSCVEGRVELELVCEPVLDYGRVPADWDLAPDGVATTESADQALRLRSDMALGVEDGRVRARHALTAGETTFCSLSWSQDLDGPASADDATAELDATASYWRRWLDTARVPDHPWRRALERSALTIKGLTYTPTGATVAALTTSLPETPGGERNWDYRYTWIRDSAFTVQALHYLELDGEADEFIEFITGLDRGDDGALQVMYGIDGRRELPESTLDHLTGYDGASPVRVGNAAHHQQQNDLFGAVLDAALMHARRSDHLPRALWPVIQAQAERATAVWSEPDQGIWETRGEPQHYTSSKVMCWVALDRAAKLARIRGDAASAHAWKATAHEIHEDVLEHGVRDGVLRQHYDTDALDASALLAAVYGFLPPDHQVLADTVAAIEKDLTHDGFVLRYRTDETDDGLEGREGTFLICSFWLVSALTIVGERHRATTLMERLLRVTSPLGLLSEELDPSGATFLGNFPQAFSHLALIEAARRLILVERVREFQ